MGILEDAFAEFRTALLPDAILTREIVDRLENDVRMRDAWPKVIKRVTTSIDLQRILFQIACAAKEKADKFEASSKWPEAWQREYENQTEAVRTLQEFLGRFPPAPGVQLEQAKESLKWTADLMNMWHQGRAQAIVSDLPASRKRNAPHVAYYKALCSALNERLGQPMCDFVGITTPVVFGMPGRIDETTVRQAWLQEKRAIELRTNSQD
jgi:hypothetical protein